MSCHCNHEEDMHATGHCCGGCGHSQKPEEIQLSEQEKSFLMRLAQMPFLPLGRFVMNSTKSDHLCSVALAPVHLIQEEDTLEQIKENGALLKDLEGKNLITLDYDMPLQGCDYHMYWNAHAYKMFVDAMREGSQREEFLFDISHIELGSIALTELGRHTITLLET